MPPRKCQPALLGGLVMGVLSALPLINLANICCCLWVITGGVVAAYLMQQGHAHPITVGDGALVGLLAGVLGAAVWAVVSLPIDLITGPLQARLLERILENAGEVPDSMRSLIESARHGTATAVQLIIGFTFMLLVGATFCTVGGVLGAILFRRDTVPPERAEILPPAP